MNKSNRLYRMTQKLKESRIILAAGMISLMAVICGLSYIRSYYTAQIIFSFNYEEASRGLNPNGTYFNAYELKSEEVLERALELAGTDELSVESLSENLSIESSENSKNGYIITQYKIVYKKNPELRSVSSDEMLQLVVYAYLEHFYKNYTDNRTILKYEKEDFDDLEYRQIATAYYTKLSQMKKYLEARQSSSANFTGEDGTTYQSLISEIDNLLEIKLANFRSYVTENGLYKQKNEYLQTLEYKNYLDQNTYELTNKIYALYEDCIAMYDARLTGIVFVPSVDEKQDFYMSKTKTGIDHLAEDAVSAKKTVGDKLEDIRHRNLIINEITTSVNDGGQIAKAKELMEEMDASILLISQKAVALDSAYTRYKNKDYITYKKVEPGFIQRLNLKRGIVAAFGLLGIACMCFFFQTEKQWTKE